MRNVGFVIANGDEEFLARYSIADGAIVRGWSRVLDLAMVFKTIREADNVVSKLDYDYPLYVLGLKESKRQYAVYPPREGHYPVWLVQH